MYPYSGARPFLGLKALMYNFDFDDATVKKEHQDWLDEYVIPVVRKERLAQVFLNGTASRIGNADYNRQLSQRREEACKHYLISKGVSPARIAATFTGATLSHSVLPDDERDRAVSVVLQLVPTLPTLLVPVSPPQRYSMPHPKYVPSAVTSRSNRHAWLRLAFGAGAGDPPPPPPPSIVPTGGGFSLEIPQGGSGTFQVINGVGLWCTVRRPIPGGPVARLVDPDNPDSGSGGLQITKDPQMLGVRGINRGSTQVIAYEQAPGSRLRAELQVWHGLPRKTVSVAFHSLTDPKNLATSRNVDKDAFITKLNDIFLGQTNVRFESTVPAATFAATDLSNVMGQPQIVIKEDGTGLPDWPKITAHRNSAMMVNVFFAKDFDNGNPATRGITDPPVNVNKGLRNSLIKDQLEGADFDICLAHEIGHALSLAHSGLDGNLMREDVKDAGRRLTSVQAVQIHQHLEKFLPK
jgi:hypothetical protein